MVDVRCRPIDHWDGSYLPDWERHRSPYEVRWERQLDELQRELEHLEAYDVTIGLDCAPSQIRVDGWPKGNASIPDPVVLTFESRVGPLRFQCDRYWPWRANLRAVGLLLHRLRLVDECGVGRSEQAYTGWQALPPGAEVGGPMTVDEAAQFIARMEGHPNPAERAPHLIDDPYEITYAYRAAAKRLHPDHGGDPALFRRLGEARDLLDRTVGEGDRA